MSITSIQVAGQSPETLDATPSVSNGQSSLIYVVPGAVVGALVALLALAPRFITGTGGKWLRPENDFCSYLIAWHYYVVDGWRIPVFAIPAMGYPEGGSVLFNDALPLTALTTKLLYRVFGLLINPFGWWILLTYVLQGVMAARLVHAVGVRSIWASTTAATLAVCSTPFLFRMGHTALSSHFLILWALAVYFESVRRRQARPVELCLLLALALLVNSYLLVMVAVLEAATVVVLWRRSQLTARDTLAILLGMTGVLALSTVSGYGVVFTNPALMKSTGFGYFSWNVATLFLPPEGFFGLLSGLARDATGGQYEGVAYIGRGGMFLLLAALLSAPREVRQLMRRHSTLCLTLTLFAVYAASNRVYFGNTLLAAYYLPERVIELCNYFRGTGRFIWPLTYAILLLPLACIFRWWRPAIAIGIAVVATVLQATEAVPAIKSHRHTTAQPYAEMIDTQLVSQWMRQHDRVWQFPSFACGGFAGLGRVWGGPDANRELQLQLTAARAGLPINSVHTSRILKDCEAESKWAQNPQLQQGVLYFLSTEAARVSPQLKSVATSRSCLQLDWATVCTLRWGAYEPRAARLQERPAFQRIPEHRWDILSR